MRLATIAESESLINNGVAITLYTALLAFVLGQDSSVSDALTLFVREMFGGILIGLAAGVGISRLNATVDDHLVEMLLSVALAYGSYVAAQWLHCSGPLACAAAGLVHGCYGRRVGMLVTTRLRLDDLWEFLGFMANAAVFLLAVCRSDRRRVACPFRAAAHAWRVLARPPARDDEGQSASYSLERPAWRSDHCACPGAGRRNALSRHIACHVLRGGPVHARRAASDTAASAAPPGSRAALPDPCSGGGVIVCASSAARPGARAGIPRDSSGLGSSLKTDVRAIAHSSRADTVAEPIGQRSSPLTREPSVGLRRFGWTLDSGVADASKSCPRVAALNRLQFEHHRVPFGGLRSDNQR